MVETKAETRVRNRWYHARDLNLRPSDKECDQLWSVTQTATYKCGKPDAAVSAGRSIAGEMPVMPKFPPTMRAPAATSSPNMYNGQEITASRNG